MFAYSLSTVILVITVNYAGSNYTVWIAPSSPLLPRIDSNIAVGYHNNSIFLFGGSYNSKQSIQFDITSQKIIDFGANILPINVYGFSQYYTQINNIVYCIDTSGDNVISYNLLNKQLLDGNIALSINVGSYGCLASNDNFLFIVGGWDNSVIARDTLQIYNITSRGWISGAPSMQIPRAFHSCIIHPISNALYAIGGGYAGNVFLKSVEKILIDDITNQNWKYIQNLSYPSTRTRAITYGNFIFIIGGMYWMGSSYHYIPEIQVINSIDDSVFVNGYLGYNVAETAAVLANNKIYAFGGYLNGNRLNTWQYLALPSDKNEMENVSTTFPTNNRESNGISIVIQFKYQIIGLNISVMIQQIVDGIINQSIDNDDCIDSDEYNITTNSKFNFTWFHLDVFVCDEFKERVQTALNDNLQTDLIEIINKKTKLVISNDLVIVAINGDRINNFISSTTVLLQITDTSIPNDNVENTAMLIYIFITVGCMLLCIVLIICVFCAYKIKKLDNEFLEQGMDEIQNQHQSTLYNIKNNERIQKTNIVLNNESEEEEMEGVTSGNLEHDIVIRSESEDGETHTNA